MESKNSKYRKKVRLVGLAGIILAGILLFSTYGVALMDGFAWNTRSEMRVIAPDFEEPSPDQAIAVPDFTLKDRFGNPVSLNQFGGVDLLVINIWSSGCPVCRQEVPELTAMDERMGELRSAVLITIAVEEKWEDVASYFPMGTNLRILFDPEDKVGKGIFGTKAYPETFVIDRNRKIRARFDGKRPWNSDVMFEYLSRFI